METDSLPFGELIKRLNTIYEKRANNNMRERDMTVSQMKMLVALDEAPENTVPLKEMERYFGVAQSTAAGVVMRLEKKGLIQSQADPADRRVKLLTLTDAGRQMCSQSRTEMNLFDDRMLSCLAEPEKIQLLWLLSRIYESEKDT